MADEVVRLPNPDPDDLYGLYKLCGSEDAVVEHIAKACGVEPVQIRQQILACLAQLPEVPPPSRQRSAPPVVAPEQRVLAQTAANSNSLFRGGSTGGPDVLRVRAPPQSAPATGSRGDIAAAMRALDSRLNQSSRARFSHRAAEVDMALPGPPSAAAAWAGMPNSAAVGPVWLGMPGVPEESEQADGDEAASRYLERSAIGAGIAAVQPDQRLKEPLASSWMTRSSIRR